MVSLCSVRGNKRRIPAVVEVPSPLPPGSAVLKILTPPPLPKPAASPPAPTMSSTAPSAIQRGQVDLVDFVDWSGVECLNQNSSRPLANALKQGYRDDEGLELESDADEQLLIYIPFMQVVKLHSILITGPEEEGPRTVKLFANKEHMGFNNVNDYPPSDSIVLSPENLKEKPVTLKYVKFQNVRSLTIFIEDNQGGSDISKVHKITLYGTTVDTTNMKDLKKIEEH